MIEWRRKILNSSEEVTHEIVRKVASENGARTYAKVRIADVLEISASGLSNTEYSYSLKAHFDFVVADKDNMALFVVEFDGPQHDHDKTAQENDLKKNAICERFNLPLLRVNSDFVSRKVRRFTILGWLIELWFIQETFNQAQTDGSIPYDEPFMYFSIMSDSVDDLAKDRINFPYDLSLPSRLFVHQCCDKGLCEDITPSVYVAEDTNG